MLKQKQKIGRSKDNRRVCLWNRKLIDAGFGVGQTIAIEIVAGKVIVKPNAKGTRKVSGVMNHGNRLPVIDIKQTRTLDLSSLGNIGDMVNVNIERGQITISK